MKKYATVLTNNFPIVEVTFTGEKANHENFSQYLTELKEVYSAEENLAIIFDAKNAVLPGVAFQKMQADWLKENDQLMKEYCVGTAYVISNVIIRNVLKAIFKFQKQPVPYFVCSSLKEADNWVNNQFKLN